MIRFGNPVEVGQIEAGTAVKILLNQASLRTETDSSKRARHSQQEPV